MQKRDAGQSQDLAVSLLRDGCWAALPVRTVELLATGGELSDIRAGATVYNEADTERIGVVVRGLLRVYMHTSDGRQVTVRYVHAGGLLGVPAVVGGPAPVFVQALTDSAVYFMDAARAKRMAREDVAVVCAFAEESVHRLYDVLEELAGNTFATVRQRVIRHCWIWPRHGRRVTGGSQLSSISRSSLRAPGEDSGDTRKSHGARRDPR